MQTYLLDLVSNKAMKDLQEYTKTVYAGQKEWINTPSKEPMAGMVKEIANKIAHVPINEKAIKLTAKHGLDYVQTDNHGNKFTGRFNHAGDAKHNTAIGNGNVFLVGDHNYVKGGMNVITGDRNHVKGSFNKVYGNNTRVNGDGLVVTCSNCTVNSQPGDKVTANPIEHLFAHVASPFIAKHGKELLEKHHAMLPEMGKKAVAAMPKTILLI